MNLKKVGDLWFRVVRFFIVLLIGAESEETAFIINNEKKENES